jgi:hypothetical protein
MLYPSQKGVTKEQLAQALKKSPAEIERVVEVCKIMWPMYASYGFQDLSDAIGFLHQPETKLPIALSEKGIKSKEEAIDSLERLLYLKSKMHSKFKEEKK